MDFIAREASRFVGRADFIKDVVDHVSSDADAPLVITGSSGTGKTALVAKLDKIFNSVSDDDVQVSSASSLLPDEVDDDHSLPSRLSEVPRAEGPFPTKYDETTLSQPSRTTTTTLSTSSSSSPSSSRHRSRSRPRSSQNCLTLINGLISPSLESFEGFLERLLAFLRFPFDAHVARVCRNLPTLAREALSIDYDDFRVVMLDGIQLLRGDSSVATKLSWLPLKLGEGKND